MSTAAHRGMRDVFLRFYFTVAICFLFAALLIGSAYKQMVDRANQRYLTDVFQATVAIIENELGDLPPSMWHDEVRRMDDKTPLPVQIEQLDAYELSPGNQNALADGDIIRLYDEDLYLHRIHETGLMVVMGPIPFLAQTDQISPEDVLALFLMCLSLGVPALLWLRPLWLDLLELSKQGRLIGSGDFHARVNLEESSALALLGSAFNRMAHDVEELTASRRAMIDAVSHDLRTPLARLRYRLETVRPSASEEVMLAIERDLTNIDQMIEEWLTMSRLDQAGVHLEKQPLEMMVWLEYLVGEYAFENAEVINETGTLYPLMLVDSYYLGRALANLLNNSRRYGGKQVQIRLTWSEGKALLCVDDDGPGIPEDQRERLLQPFEQLDTNHNHRSGGFGLGLTIVARIMHAHDGSIAIQDSPLGGARIALSWPTYRRDVRAFGG